MPATDADTPARDAIDAFIRSLADRGFAASTRRLRRRFLDEYLRHALRAAETAQRPYRLACAFPAPGCFPSATVANASPAFRRAAAKLMAG